MVLGAQSLVKNLQFLPGMVQLQYNGQPSNIGV